MTCAGFGASRTGSLAAGIIATSTGADGCEAFGTGGLAGVAANSMTACDEGASVAAGAIRAVATVATGRTSAGSGGGKTGGSVGASASVCAAAASMAAMTVGSAMPRVSGAREARGSARAVAAAGFCRGSASGFLEGLLVRGAIGVGWIMRGRTRSIACGVALASCWRGRACDEAQIVQHRRGGGGQRRDSRNRMRGIGRQRRRWCLDRRCDLHRRFGLGRHDRQAGVDVVERCDHPQPCKHRNKAAEEADRHESQSRKHVPALRRGRADAENAVSALLI